MESRKKNILLCPIYNAFEGNEKSAGNNESHKEKSTGNDESTTED